MSTSAAQEDNVSITATEATVAGSSVAITEAEEDLVSFGGGGGGTSADINNGKVTITKEHSLDISIANDTSEGVNDEEEEEEDAAPMHLHALRTPAKLKGAARSRSSSRSRPGSRRSSSSPEGKAVAAMALGELVLGSTVSPSASVGSSLDGIGDHHHHHSDVDPDILLDKLGFRDLDPNATQEELQELLRKHISSQGGLPTLNERMSEATMDDTQAFHDLSYVVGKKASASASSSIDEGDGEEGNSPEKAARTEAAVRLAQLKSSGLSNSAVFGTMTPLLNTLDEGEGEDDVDEGDDDNKGKKSRSNSAVEEGEEDVVVEIPAGLVNLKKKNSNNRRDTFNSIATIGQISSQDEEDDEDTDNADVVVPTEVVNELNINEGRRKLLHSDTSMAVVTGTEPDYLEADEQDGLEADQASDEEEPPR